MWTVESTDTCARAGQLRLINLHFGIKCFMIVGLGQVNVNMLWLEEKKLSQSCWLIIKKPTPRCIWRKCLSVNHKTFLSKFFFTKWWLRSKSKLFSIFGFICLVISVISFELIRWGFFLDVFLFFSPLLRGEKALPSNHCYSGWRSKFW